MDPDTCSSNLARKSMLVGLLFGFVLILGAAIWRAISVKRKAPGEKHTIAEYVDPFCFPEDDDERHQELYQGTYQRERTRGQLRILST